MRKFLFITLLVLFWAGKGVSSNAWAQNEQSSDAKVEAEEDDGELFIREKPKVVPKKAAVVQGPALELTEPDDELETAIVFLNKIPHEEQQYIRFFTTYAVAPQKRDRVAVTLSFVIHSLTGLSLEDNESAGSYYPLAKKVGEKDKVAEFKHSRRVPGSKTLYWIDLRDHNWTPEVWEKLSALDGYFVSPVVDYDKYGLLRLLAGNAIVRADWFILHATDMTRQVDTDKKTLMYDELLYAKNKIPKTIDEWRVVWGFDKVQAEKLGADFATLVTKSRVVSKSGTRIMYGYRTPLGYVYDTYDVKNLEGRRDYAENLTDFKGKPPDISDGGETIGVNQLRMQIYNLRDAKGNLVAAADAGIVRHTSDILEDARVITGRSCIDCHAQGPIPSENTLREFLAEKNISTVKDKRDKLRIDRVFLSDKFEDAIIEDQEMFAKALLKVNGLTPDENGKFFLEAIYDYNKDVTLEQAAFECGVTVDQFKQKMAKINSLRVAKLCSKSSEPIPRQAWETPGKDGQPGLFQLCMLQIKGLTAKITEKRVVDEREIIDVVTVKINAEIFVTDPEGKTINLGKVLQGDKLEVFEFRKDGWVGVKFKGRRGFIDERTLESEK